MPLTSGKMRLDHERKIRKNIIQLKRDMDAKELTDYFIEREIFDFPDVEKINGYNPNTADNRNTCFLQLLLQSGDSAYDVFLQSLRRNQQDYLADLVDGTQLVNEEATHGEPYSWINSIPPNVKNRRLGEKDISRLAQVLGKEWEFAVLDMGLSQVEIDHCKMENHTPVMTIYSALNKWRLRTSDACTLGNLVAILKNSQATTVDWKTMERIARQMQG